LLSLGNADQIEQAFYRVTVLAEQHEKRFGFHAWVAKLPSLKTGCEAVSGEILRAVRHVE